MSFSQNNIMTMLVKQGLLSVAIVLFAFAALPSYRLAWSVLLGVLIQAIPMGYFSFYVFSKTYPSITANLFLRRLYRAEIQKLVISGLLFFVSFKLSQVSPIAVLSGWGAAQLAFYLTLMQGVLLRF